MVWCGCVWCGVVWCAMVWCNVVFCGVLWFCVIWSDNDWDVRLERGPLSVSAHTSACAMAWSVYHEDEIAYRAISEASHTRRLQGGEACSQPKVKTSQSFTHKTGRLPRLCIILNIKEVIWRNVVFEIEGGCKLIYKSHVSKRRRIKKKPAYFY